MNVGVCVWWLYEHNLTWHEYPFLMEGESHVYFLLLLQFYIRLLCVSDWVNLTTAQWRRRPNHYGTFATHYISARIRATFEISARWLKWISPDVQSLLKIEDGSRYDYLSIYMLPRSYLGWIQPGSASIRRWWPWILAVKPHKNCLDLGCMWSYAYHSFLMSTSALNYHHNPSIVTSESALATFDF